MQVQHGLDFMCVTATRPGGLEHCYSRLRRRAERLRGIQDALAIAAVVAPAIAAVVRRSPQGLAARYPSRGGYMAVARYVADLPPIRTRLGSISYLEEILQPLSIGL